MQGIHRKIRVGRVYIPFRAFELLPEVESIIFEETYLIFREDNMDGVMITGYNEFFDELPGWEKIPNKKIPEYRFVFTALHGISTPIITTIEKVE